MGSKRVQITSNFTSEADHLFKRIEEEGGKVTKVVEKTSPSKNTSSTTVTTNPYTAATGASKDNTGTRVSDATAAKIDKGGYDTSQL